MTDHSPDHAERAREAVRDIRNAMHRSLRSGHKQAHMNYGPLTACLDQIDAALRGRDRVVEALEKIAAFEPKPIRGTVSEQSATLGWNRAGEWAARVAASGLAFRAALHDAKVMRDEGNG